MIKVNKYTKSDGTKVRSHKRSEPEFPELKKIDTSKLDFSQKKEETLSNREKAYTKDLKREDYLNLRIYRGTTIGGKPFVTIYRGRAEKPYTNYSFGTEDRRENYIQEQKNWEKEQFERKQKFKEGKKKAIENIKDYIKVGDIFYTSWGYDQTNMDYIIVTEVSPSGKSVICRRTDFEVADRQMTYDMQKPTAEPFGEEFRMLVDVGYDGNSVSLKGSYPYLHTGEGSKRRGYFSKWDGEQTFYETNPMFGH